MADQYRLSFKTRRRVDLTIGSRPRASEWGAWGDWEPFYPMRESGFVNGVFMDELGVALRYLQRVLRQSKDEKNRQYVWRLQHRRVDSLGGLSEWRDVGVQLEMFVDDSDGLVAISLVS